MGLFSSLWDLGAMVWDSNAMLWYGLCCKIYAWIDCIYMYLYTVMWKNSTLSGVGLDFSEKQRACVRKGSPSRDIASCIIYLIIHQYIWTCFIYQFYEWI